MKFTWISSYDWLIEHLLNEFCSSKQDCMDLLDWMHKTSSRHVCETIYELFGTAYISKEMADCFKLEHAAKQRNDNENVLPVMTTIFSLKYTGYD